MPNALTMIRALPRRQRIIVLIAGSVLILLLVLLILAASFPASWLKAAAEGRLSQQVGSPVSIGSMERESAFSLRPVIRLGDIRVPQPDWAGPGDLATIRTLRIRLRLLPLALGNTGIDLLSARGVRLTLIRDEDRRKSWAGRETGDEGGGSGMEIPATHMDDVVIDYRDAFQKRRFTVTLAVDPRQGLRGNGKGTVEGAPVDLRIIGGPMVAGQPWSFDARIEGEALAMHAAGVMAGPLRTDDMTFQLTARASDLKLIDRIIEAGLFRTQPVDLRADVRHRDNLWSVAKLSGSIGRSELTGQLTARQTDGHTRLQGEARFRQLDFEDLADDAGNAEAVALERAIGLRLVPNTRINIHKIDTTDGRIAIRIDRILDGRRPSSLTDIQAVLNLEDRLLTIEPLRIGLTQGAISGKAIVDQRKGQPKPTVTLALDMRNSSIAALAGGGGNSEGDIEGRVDARVRLTGVGDTIREAVGTSSGTIGAVTRGGSMPTRLAGLLGFDIGKGLFGDSDEREALRCGIIHLDVKGGRGTTRSLIVDTSISQTRGSGTLTFPAERIDMTLTGAAKSKHALQLPGSVNLRGSIREPEVDIPEGTRSLGNILKAVGRAIGGRAESATDANCPALIGQAIG